jgi:hypothetical protein
MVKKNLRKYSCNICNKEYASSGSLWCHNNKFHKEKVQVGGTISEKRVVVSGNISEKKVVVGGSLIDDSKKYSCCYCNKKIADKSNKYKHQKICKKNIISKKEDENNVINTSTTNIINNTSNINNGTINNIVINQIGKESIDCLKIKDILSIANDRLNGPITCIKKLNFNKSLPQNHSFCSTSLEGNYFTTVNHKTQKTEKISKKDLIHKVLNSSLDFIEGIALHLEFNKDFQNKIPIEYLEKIQFILDNKYKFYEKKNLLIFGNSINSMSYNYKDLIMSTWELLQPLEDDTSSEYSEPDIKEVTNFSSDEEDEDSD